MFPSGFLLFIDEEKRIQLVLSMLCNTALDTSRTVQIRSIKGLIDTKIHT